MASKKENIKSLFSNTRSRIIILFTAAILGFGIVMGVVKFRAATTAHEVKGASQLGVNPGSISGTPGSSDPTQQYATLQQKQNVDEAKRAITSGDSAIPTIIRTQSFGDGIKAVGPQHGKGGLGFSSLSRDDQDGPEQTLWLQALKDANCSKAAVDKVIGEGAGISVLRQACSCLQLKDNGYHLGELESICSCKDLKAAGYNARQLKNEGFSAVRLRRCGFNACELKGAGFTAQQLKDAGFTDGELKGAGYSKKQIDQAGGLPAGITAADVRKAGCSVAGLRKLRDAGVSAAAVRRISGCSAEQMKAAGYSARALRNAGFSAAELKKAGFSAAQLKDAGYSARDLLNAGFTPKELSAVGFTPAEIKTAETELPPGMTPEDVKDAGCSVAALKRERAAGVSAALIHRYAACSAAALKEAGFSDDALKNAGFTPKQIEAANQAAEEKAKQGDADEKISDAAIRAAGCEPDKLAKLHKEGVSAKRIRMLNGCSARALKDAGFDARSLANAGFTPRQLLAAGFTPQQLIKAGLRPSGSIAAGRKDNCSVASLSAARKMGVSALTIKQTLGCSANALKDAGYTAKELKDAGFTAAELKAAGFNANQLKAAGFSAKELRDAGFSAAALKAAGFTANQLKDAGFSAGELKNAGFSAKELKDAGFSAAALKAAGFSAAALKNAGFSAKELKDAGFSANQLKDAGFGSKALQKAGFTKAELSEAGFSFPDSAVAGLDDAPTSATDMTTLPTIGSGPKSQAEQAVENAKRLQNVLSKQQKRMAEQRYKQNIQQLSGQMMSDANKDLQEWKSVSSQVFVAGTPLPTQSKKGAHDASGSEASSLTHNRNADDANVPEKALVKAGDVLFAVLDTAVNTDQPGPILATIVAGNLKGTKLIGSFNLPGNSDKMVINFNMMSIPGTSGTTSITAYAIDPNTGRTALASRSDHHYLLRYGSLFASHFLEGFGNAFQSANTTVQIGGTGGVSNTTISNGVGRSVLENAVIGLATVGKSWGRVAQEQFSTPTTVELFSGTGLGILFMQNVSLTTGSE